MITDNNEQTYEKEEIKNPKGKEVDNGQNWQRERINYPFSNSYPKIFADFLT